jgi:hypothetical protein
VGGMVRLDVDGVPVPHVGLGAVRRGQSASAGGRNPVFP